MANKDDYLTDYRRFFENFAQTVNPNDQLPVKLGSYKLVNVEVVGGIIDWTTQYLSQKRCPQSLIAPLIKIVIEEVRNLCKKQPVACGFNVSDNAYEPLRLMQTVMAKTNEICLRYLDNSKLCSLPTPGPPYNMTTAYAVKNNRRRMEDRHVIIHDLNSLFIEQEASPSSYYAIFDGHAGHDAAAYSCAHLHQFLGESKDFISNPEQALRDAFLKTDALFLDKCKVENFSSGSTAVCALLRHKEKTLYIAWVGDSQALLVSQGRLVQCVQPHKPSREDEKNRIEREGGVVIYWGTWRVNGQLAVSRAIGDLEYKPYVTAVPDVVEIPLTGNEDFLILACDGLWDFISEDDAARCVYSVISQNPDDIDSISQHLVQLAKQQGSTDNISVIVVFLRETSKVAAEAHWATRNGLIMDTLDNANTTTNPFANSNNPDILAQKEGFVLNLADGFKQNGTEKSPAGDFLGRPTNGKRSADEFDDDDDLGPETDVDAVDDVLLSPAIAAAKSLAEGFVNNNPFDPFCDKEEKATLETDSELQKQQTSEFDPVKSPREETPTPPADSVHDASGLVDNVADSGEDSDDEWNYFKGDTAQKENIPPSQTDKEVCELTQSSLDSDTMSQLNPNAAEFVPVSPKRNTASPAYQALIDDSVIAQSPRRIVANNDIDISVPNPQEFESEIKSRPSDVRECANGDEESKLSSQEIMENLLNGKSMDEIEFQPNSTPTKVHKGDEFHFGPNATPFSTPAKLLDQSEALSTKAVFGDESTASYLDGKGFDDSFSGNDGNESQTFSKEQDPMSMSFYQDKDDDTNPFDLNKVQVLPENIDDFLEKPNESASLLNDTISDLPEHNPSDLEKVDEINQAAGDSIGISVAEPMEREAIAPFGDHMPVVVAESPLPVSHSPLPGARSPLSGQRTPLSPTQSPLPMAQSPLPMADSPLPMADSPLPDEEFPVCELKGSRSPLPAMESPQPGSQSPLPAADSPLPTADSPLPIAQSPVPPSLLSQSPVPPSKSPLLQSQSPLPVSECILPTTQSPLAASPSPVPLTQSPLPTSQSPVPPSQSPLPTSQSPLPPSRSPLPPSQSPLPTLQSPIPPVQSPVATAQSPFLCESPLASQSPLPLAHSPVPPHSPLRELESPLASHSPLPLAHSPVPPHSPLRELESPVEDITSSVKDSPILAASPIDNKALDEPNIFADNYAQQISDAIEETVAAEIVSPVNNLEKDVLIPEMCTVSTPKSVESEHVDMDSVTTTDVNSFLERSLLPEVASPLSPSGDENKLLDAFTSELEANKLEDAGFTVPSSLTIMAQDILIPTGSQTHTGSIDVDIKSEIIAPEYPVQTIATPSEESKTEDITQNEAAVVAPVTPQETKENIPEVAAVAATAAAVTAAVAVTAVAEKKTLKSKSGAAPAAKKPAPKAATSPTKPTAAKPSPRLSATTKTSTTAASKVTQARTSTTPTASPKQAAKPLPKPKTAPITKALDKKPLTNGEVKPPPIKRSALPAATRTTTTKPVPSKLSPTKTSTDGKATTGTARPATAPPKSTTLRQTATSARPSNLVKMSSVTSSSRTTASTVTATKSTVRTTTLTSPKAPISASAKPRPATVPPRPKPLGSKPAPRAADTEKQIKETANKQITASRTSTMTRTAGGAGKTTTTTLRKTEVKAPGARMTVTKTTTSTMRTTDVKKPAELIRHPPSKTKVGIKKPKAQQNGIPVEVNTITISPTNIEPQLIKDVSPVVENLVFDNAQITEINNVTD